MCVLVFVVVGGGGGGGRRGENGLEKKKGEVSGGVCNLLGERGENGYLSGGFRTV